MMPDPAGWARLAATGGKGPLAPIAAIRSRASFRIAILPAGVSGLT